MGFVEMSGEGDNDFKLPRPLRVHPFTSEGEFSEQCQWVPEIPRFARNDRVNVRMAWWTMLGAYVIVLLYIMAGKKRV